MTQEDVVEDRELKIVQKMEDIAALEDDVESLTIRVQ